MKTMPPCVSATKNVLCAWPSNFSGGSFLYGDERFSGSCCVSLCFFSSSAALLFAGVMGMESLSLSSSLFFSGRKIYLLAGNGHGRDKIMLFQRLANGLMHGLADPFCLLNFHFRLLRMDIYVDGLRIQLERQKEHGMLVYGQKRMVRIGDGFRDVLVPHPALVDKQNLLALVFPGLLGLGNIPFDADPCFFSNDGQAVSGQLCAK